MTETRDNYSALIPTKRFSATFTASEDESLSSSPHIVLLNVYCCCCGRKHRICWIITPSDALLKSGERMRVIPPGQVTHDGARRNNTTQQQSINKGYNSNRILTIEEYGPGRKEGRCYLAFLSLSTLQKLSTQTSPASCSAKASLQTSSNVSSERSTPTFLKIWLSCEGRGTKDKK